MIYLLKVFPLQRLFTTALLVLLILMGVNLSTMADSAPFSGFHIFDPVKGIPGSFIAQVSPHLGPIGYFNQISNNSSSGGIVGSQGWLYAPKAAGSNTSGVSIVYTLIQYPSESAAKNVVDTVFRDPFIQKFQEYKKDYNQEQYKKALRQIRPSDSIIGFINNPTLYPGKKTISYGATQNFEAWTFSGQDAPCGNRHVVAYKFLRYWLKSTSTIIQSPAKGWIRHNNAAIQGKIVSNQGYYRILRSGNSLMVINVDAQKQGDDPTTGKPIGDSSPPDMLNKYWNIVEQESRNYVCTNAVTKNIAITLSMPKTRELFRFRRLIFGPAFPDFQTAHISGHVTYEDLFHRGDIRFADVIATVYYHGKILRTKRVKTDNFGFYDLTLPINKKGSRPAEELKMNIIRRLSGYDLPASSPPQNNGNLQGSTQHKQTQSNQIQDWKITFWNKITKLNALEKDREYQKTGGIGSPNMDQWRKNHAHGRDNINALKFLFDWASAPATKSAQMVENVNIFYKRVTGKSLPLVKTTDKNSPNAMKTAGNNFFQHLKDLKNSGIGK